MASRIQGITVEIGGDTTKLQNALKGVNGQIKSTQSQLKDVNKLLKLDPGNTELLAQKHKLLAEAVSETKEKLATLKTAAEQANTALANGEISKEQYDALQREIVETEQDLKNLETQANQSATAVQKIAATGEKFKTNFKSIFRIRLYFAQRPCSALLNKQWVQDAYKDSFAVKQRCYWFVVSAGCFHYNACIRLHAKNIQRKT